LEEYAETGYTTFEYRPSGLLSVETVKELPGVESAYMEDGVVKGKAAIHVLDTVIVKINELSNSTLVEGDLVQISLRLNNLGIIPKSIKLNGKDRWIVELQSNKDLCTLESWEELWNPPNLKDNSVDNPDNPVEVNNLISVSQFREAD
jgi:hypothetical protein